MIKDTCHLNGLVSGYWYPITDKGSPWYTPIGLMLGYDGIFGGHMTPICIHHPTNCKRFVFLASLKIGMK